MMGAAAEMNMMVKEETAVILIRDGRFEPDHLYLARGQCVRWINDEDNADTLHQVHGKQTDTIALYGEGTEPVAFFSSPLRPRESFVQRFNGKGSFVCKSAGAYGSKCVIDVMDETDLKRHCLAQSAAALQSLEADNAQVAQSVKVIPAPQVCSQSARDHLMDSSMPPSIAIDLSHLMEMPGALSPPAARVMSPAFQDQCRYNTEDVNVNMDVSTVKEVCCANIVENSWARGAPGDSKGSGMDSAFVPCNAPSNSKWSESNSSGAWKEKAPQNVSVKITEAGFAPSYLRVPVGSTVTWVVDAYGFAEHELEGRSDVQELRFRSPILQHGHHGSYIFEVSREGRIEVHGSGYDNTKMVIEVTPRREMEPAANAESEPVPMDVVEEDEQAGRGGGVDSEGGQGNMKKKMKKKARRRKGGVGSEDAEEGQKEETSRRGVGHDNVSANRTESSAQCDETILRLRGSEHSKVSLDKRRNNVLVCRRQHDAEDLIRVTAANMRGKSFQLPDACSYYQRIPSDDEDSPTPSSRSGPVGLQWIGANRCVRADRYDGGSSGSSSFADDDDDIEARLADAVRRDRADPSRASEGGRLHLPYTELRRSCDGLRRDEGSEGRAMRLSSTALMSLVYGRVEKEMQRDEDEDDDDEWTAGLGDKARRQGSKKKKKKKEKKGKVKKGKGVKAGAPTQQEVADAAGDITVCAALRVVNRAVVDLQDDERLFGDKQEETFKPEAPSEEAAAMVGTLSPSTSTDHEGSSDRSLDEEVDGQKVGGMETGVEEEAEEQLALHEQVSTTAVAGESLEGGGEEEQYDDDWEEENEVCGAFADAAPPPAYSPVHAEDATHALESPISPGKLGEDGNRGKAGAVIDDEEPCPPYTPLDAFQAYDGMRREDESVNEVEQGAQGQGVALGAVNASAVVVEESPPTRQETLHEQDATVVLPCPAFETDKSAAVSEGGHADAQNSLGKESDGCAQPGDLKVARPGLQLYVTVDDGQEEEEEEEDGNEVYEESASGAITSSYVQEPSQPPLDHANAGGPFLGPPHEDEPRYMGHVSFPMYWSNSQGFWVAYAGVPPQSAYSGGDVDSPVVDAYGLPMGVAPGAQHGAHMAPHTPHLHHAAYDQDPSLHAEGFCGYTSTAPYGYVPEHGYDNAVYHSTHDLQACTGRKDGLREEEEEEEDEDIRFGTFEVEGSPSRHVSQGEMGEGGEQSEHVHSEQEAMSVRALREAEVLELACDAQQLQPQVGGKEQQPHQSPSQPEGDEEARRKGQALLSMIRKDDAPPVQKRLEELERGARKRWYEAEAWLQEGRAPGMRTKDGREVKVLFVGNWPADV